MKKQILTLLICLLAALLMAGAALAADTPGLSVDADGVVTGSAGSGNTLYLAAYDPVTGQFLGLVENGAPLAWENAALKAIQTGANHAPVSEARSLLALADGDGSCSGGTYDAAVVTSQAAGGTLRLSDMTICGDLDVFGACSLVLDGVDVQGTVNVDVSSQAALMAEGGRPSIVITGASGVGSVRIRQTADGGVSLRTEEGCRVTWVFVDDGRGDIVLDGAFNQVVVDTENAAVKLENAEVSGLSIRRAGAEVTLAGETQVTAARFPAGAEGASLTAGAGTKLFCVEAEAANASLSGEGTVVRAEVSGSGCRVDTVGTWLSVHEGATGVTQNGNAAAPGETVKTGPVTPGTPGGEPEMPEAHRHVWASGCRTEASAERSGFAGYVCTVCGEVRTGELSYEPYAVTVAVSEDGTERETRRFATLEEALAFAGQHPEEWPDGVGGTVFGYVGVDLVGADVLDKLALPRGYSLWLADGGRLTVTGGFCMGSAREEDGRYVHEGELSVPLNRGWANALTVGDQKLYDGAAPESGVLTFEAREAGDERLVIAGGYLDMDETVTPSLALLGGNAANEFSFCRDCDLNGYFTGVQITGDSDALIKAELRAPAVWAWGGESMGAFLLSDEKAALLTDALSAGFTDACTIRVLTPDAYAQPTLVVREPDRVQVISGNVLVCGACDLSAITLNTYIGDPARYTLTVAEGVRAQIRQDRFVVPESFTLLNRGRIEVYSELLCGDEIENDGELILCAFREEEAEQEDAYRFGTLRLQGGAARLTNRGTLRLKNVAFTNSHGDPDGRFAELCAEEGAALHSTPEGKIENNGILRIRSGSVLDNQGLLQNREYLELEAPEEEWLARGDEAAALLKRFAPCSLLNGGTLENEGFLRLSGAAMENTGVFDNRGDFQAESAENVRRIITVSRVDSAPEDVGDWECFWEWTDEEETSWWRVESEERVANGAPLAASLLIGEGAEFLNEEQAHFEGVELTVQGRLTNGGLTGVGDEENGSWANVSMNGGTLTNRGEIVNNGGMYLDETAYVQADEARLTNYNTAGLELRGGSMIVPSGAWLKNEGYMRITDRYGEVFAPCDLSGFADFFTTWNLEGNDSHWCDFAAEVYDFAGYRQAVAAQHERAEINPNTCYNRLDFCGDVTFTEDTRFEDFHDYWIQLREETRWRRWDEEANDWIDAEEGEEGAEPYRIRVGNTLTVADGVTLAIAPGNALRLDGEEWMMAQFDACRLVVKGRLVTEAGQEGTEENGWDWREEGFVEVWAFGAFDASEGEVVNDGRFEIRYYDMGHGEETDGEFRYVHEGRFERPEACAVVGAPADAVCAAEVRSAAGFKNAAVSAGPVFSRLYLREDTCVTLTEDLTVSQDIDVEPGSGLIVEHGASLTMEGHFWNDGDVSIYGDLLLNGSLDNNQNLEVGALSGSEQARIVLGGFMELREQAAFTLYPTGSLVLLDGSELWNRVEDEARFVRVTLEGMPQALRGVRLPALTLDKAGRFERCLFEGTLTLNAADGAEYVFEDACTFMDDVILKADGKAPLRSYFGGSAVMAEGKRVVVTHDEGADLQKLLDENSVDLGGVNGLEIVSDTSIWVNPGWIDADAAGYTLNGVSIEHRRTDGGWIDGSVSLRFEPRDGDVYRVFQVDGGWDCVVRLCGALEGIDELRLMQGQIDVSGLSTGSARVNVSDMWAHTCVDLGGNSAVLSEHYDPAQHEQDEGFPLHGAGWSITASEGAEIRVQGAVMLWNDEESFYDYTTAVELSVGETNYFLDPHIFGAVHGKPAVYVGIKDENAVFHLRCGDRELPFEVEYLCDEWNGEEHWKTHLLPKEGADWFEAGENLEPGLVLTVELPGGVTVIFDTVPVKPEWNEPEA